MKDYPVKFASCEDLVIHKLFAARAIDEEDVKNILLKNKGRVDRVYIRQTLAEFTKLPGQEKIILRFKRLWEEANQ